MPTAPPSRINAPWLHEPPRARVFAALAARGFAARAVGGAVRNTLLGVPVIDVDVATPATPDQVIEAAVHAGLKAIPTGVAHGTVTVVVDGAATEVTTLREDVETHGRHARVAFTEDWAADASRRDFTMNALYCDAQGQLYDPLGGYDDLIAKRVRFIGDASTRIREDYLRILRFFRFNAQYGEGAADREGVDACVHERVGLARLSGERVQQELRRLLQAPRAQAMIEAMIDHGLATLVLGRAPRLRPFLRMLALQAARSTTPDPIARLAVLAIDVEDDATHLQSRLKLANADAGRLLHMAGAARVTAAPTERQARAQLYASGAEAYGDAVLYAWARSYASLDDPAWLAAWSLPQHWQPPAFPLGGKDAVALGMPPGPAMGEALRALEVEWIASDFALDAEVLQSLLAERATSAGDAARDR